MAKKKEETKEKSVDTFDILDNMINDQFDDVLDLSKTDTRVKTWYDIGVYALNYAMSKNLKAGVPAGRIVSLDGLKGTGKSLMAASTMKDNKFDMLIILETEGGGHAQELIEFAGVDMRKVRILKSHTFGNYKIKKSNGDIEEVSDDKFPKNTDTDQFLYKEGAIRKVKRFIQALEFNPKLKDAKIGIILDSLGNLQSVREFKGTPDMGARSIDIGKFFRTFDTAFEQSNISFIFTNKLYTNIGNIYDPFKASGGVNVEYNPSLSVRFEEIAATDDITDADMKKEKERRKTSLGNSVKTIRANIIKSRFGTEGRRCWFLLDMSVGPVRLSGLFTLLKDFGLIKQSGSRYSIAGWNGDNSFYKKDFINLVMKDEENNINAFQEMLDNREAEIKEERKSIQANDIFEVPVENNDGDSDTENEYGDMVMAMEKDQD